MSVHASSLFETTTGMKRVKQSTRHARINGRNQQTRQEYNQTIEKPHANMPTSLQTTLHHKTKENLFTRIINMVKRIPTVIKIFTNNKTKEEVEKTNQQLREIKALLEKMRALHFNETLDDPSATTRIFNFLKENIPKFFVKVFGQTITYHLCIFIAAAFALFLLQKTAFFDVEAAQSRVLKQCNLIETQLEEATDKFIKAQSIQESDKHINLTNTALLQVKLCISKAENLQVEVIGHRNVYTTASCVSGALTAASLASCTYFKADPTHPVFVTSAFGAAIFSYVTYKCTR